MLHFDRQTRYIRTRPPGRQVARNGPETNEKPSSEDKTQKNPFALRAPLRCYPDWSAFANSFPKIHPIVCTHVNYDPMDECVLYCSLFKH